MNLIEIENASMANDRYHCNHCNVTQFSLFFVEHRSLQPEPNILLVELMFLFVLSFFLSFVRSVCEQITDDFGK